MKNDFSNLRNFGNEEYNVLYLPKLTKEYEAVVDIAIDTSGSTDEYIPMFLTHIKHITELSNISGKIIYCSSEISKVSDYPPFKIEKNITSGSTDFEPVFRWIRNKQSDDIDALVYLTDGFANSGLMYPQSAPPYPVLWVVIPNEGETNNDVRNRMVKWGDILLLRNE